MSISHEESLLAWIERCDGGEFVAAFVGEGAAPGAIPNFPGRAPATRRCPTPAQARRWIEDEAAAFDLPVKWLTNIANG